MPNAFRHPEMTASLLPNTPEALADDPLWQRLQDYRFDHPHHPRPFSRRLMQAGNWSYSFTQRVQEEYRRFLFLAVLLNGRVCPSEEVDLAWHTHLLASAHYFNEFCPQVLGRTLHHYPSTGLGKSSPQQDYADTLAAYEEVFGHPPPEDIWPPLTIRFKSSFFNVQSRTHWVWRKPGWWPKAQSRAGAWASGSLPVAFWLLGAAIILFGAQAYALHLPDPNPAPSLNGQRFLARYLAVLVVLLLAQVFVQMLEHSAESRYRYMSLVPEDYGYLKGGAARAVYVALAGLMQRGSIQYDPVSQGWRAPLPPIPGNTDLETALLYHLSMDTDLKTIIPKVEPQLDALHARLFEGGFVKNPDRSGYSSNSWLMKGMTAVWIIFFLIGLLRVIHGFQDGFPVILLIFAMAFGWCAWRLIARFVFAQTRLAQEALYRAESRICTNASLSDPRLLLSVALLGTAAFAASEIDLAKSLVPGLRDSSGSSCSGSSCSGSSCSGDGGGGGGCGGCGGGD